ncbi:MAG: NUDIX hydrolase [Planctomycetota bacterium]
MRLKHKVFAYITHEGRLLVFRHPGAPEAGIQVPAGSLAEGEAPDAAVLREAHEETGLAGLRLGAFLGRADHVVPDRGEVHRRRFYHLVLDGAPPERWRHAEADPSDGTEGPIPFELYWVPLDAGVPPLAPGHDRMLPRLLEILAGEA